MTQIHNILRIDASARHNGSVTRSLADETMDYLAEAGPVRIHSRNVAAGIPFIDETWVAANFTPVEARNSEQRAKLELSDELIGEINAADTLVIATPIYNFGIPATLKAWVDQIARAGVTFKYTESGPVGLLDNKRAIILVASGGTPVGSDMDFATSYLKFVLGFIGIDDVTIIAADAMGRNAEEKRAQASLEIKNLKVA